MHIHAECEVRHSPEYFNRTCRATIPEYWEAELILSEEILDALGEKVSPHSHFRMYGTSQDSRKDAILDLCQQLLKAGLTGTMKILG